MKKLLVIGLAVLMILGLATMGMAETEVDIEGSVLAGYLDINAYEYVGDVGTSDLSCHHSFEAWGAFATDVEFYSGFTGSTTQNNLEMNILQAESTSYANFEAIWRQDFDVTWTGHAGVVGLYAEGTEGTVMNSQRNAPFYCTIAVVGDPISAKGDYLVESWMEFYDSYSDIGTAAPTDWSFMSVEGTGGEATMDFIGTSNYQRNSVGGYTDSCCGGIGVHHTESTVNVDFGTGTYTRFVGGDDYLAFEGFIAPGGGSWYGSGTFNDGMTADPWATTTDIDIYRP